MDSIKALTNWGYFVSSHQEDETMHQFGWRNGLNFYLTDFGVDDKERFVLAAYKDSNIVSTHCMEKEGQALETIKDILKNQ